MMRLKNVRTLILDLGDVLFRWSPPNSTSIPKGLWKEFRSSPIWYEYDCGRIGEAEFHSQLADRFAINALEISKAFSQARDSLIAEEAVIDVIRKTRKTYGDQIRIYAMSNMSRPDWKFLEEYPFDWSLFDGVFTSGEVGMCKPELRFFDYVLKTTTTAPKDALFLDDMAENVLAARSLGIRSIQVKDIASSCRQMINLLGDPVARGKEFLLLNERQLHSTSDQGHIIQDNFSQLLIFEATGNRSLVQLEDNKRTWNYFTDTSVNHFVNCPDDLGTTAIAMLLLPFDNTVAHSVMDEMLSLRTPDGIIMTYFDETRSRTDPVVCINVVRTFYLHERGEQVELQPTKTWIQNVLLNGAYLDGTRYYQSPDAFLFFFSRLLIENNTSEFSCETAPVLREQLKSRINADGGAMELAMRILACHAMSVENELDPHNLLRLQCEDGGWEIGWLCRTGKRGIRLGNRGYTTALAINAIQALDPH